MVLEFKSYDSNTHTVHRVGYLHNGEVLKAIDEGFPDFVDSHLNAEATRDATRRDLRRHYVSDASFSSCRRHHLERPPLSANDELSVIRRFKPPYGNYASIVSPFPFRDQLAELEAPVDPVSPPRPADLSKTEINLQVTPFSETLPTYSVRIHGTGFVVFEGRNQTSVTRTHGFRVDQSVIADLIDAVYDSGFFELKHTYIDETNETRAVAVGVRIADTERWVYDYGTTPPPQLDDLVTTLTTRLGLTNWIEGDEATLLSALTTGAVPPASTLAALRGRLASTSASDPTAVATAVTPFLESPSASCIHDATALLAKTLTAASVEPAPYLQTLPAFLGAEDRALRRLAAQALDSLGVLTDATALAELVQNASVEQTRVIADELAIIAYETPGRLEEVCQLLVYLFQVDDARTNGLAGSALCEIAAHDTTWVASHQALFVAALHEAAGRERDAATILSHLDPEPLFDGLEAMNADLRAGAVSGVVDVVDRDPTTGFGAVDSLIAITSDDSTQSRRDALTALTTIAERAPDAVLPLRSAYVERLFDDDARVRTNAATFLSVIATHHPPAFDDAARTSIEEAITDPNEDVRQQVGEILLSIDHPEPLIGALSSADVEIRKTAAMVLAADAPRDSSIVTGHHETISGGLTDESASVRASVMKLIAKLVQDDPAYGASYRQAVRGQFADDASTVRQYTVQAALPLFSPETLASLLEHTDASVRETAAKTLVSHSKGDTTALIEIIPRLTPMLDEASTAVTRHLTQVLAAVAMDHPQVVQPAIPALRAALAVDSRFVHANVCYALAAIGEETPTQILETVPAVAPFLESQYEDTRKAALQVLLVVGRTHPEEIKPAVPALVDFIDQKEFPVAASATLGSIAKEYPAVAEPAITTYHTWLSAPDYRVRNNALAALADLASTYPDDVVRASTTAIDLLEDADDRVRYNATSFIARIARTHPEAVADAPPALRSVLDDEFAETRSNACWALGRLGDDTNLPMLRELTERDPDESVRAAAHAGIEYIQYLECDACGHNPDRTAVSLAIEYPHRSRWECPRCEATVYRNL